MMRPLPRQLQEKCEMRAEDEAYLTIRSYSGLSGDMLCCGLGVIWLCLKKVAPASREGDAALNEIVEKIMPELSGAAKITRKTVNGICGRHLLVNLPHTHEHRKPADIAGIIDASDMPGEAKKIARACIDVLAACEAQAHGIAPEDVHFHEIGALDSILDVCLAASLYVEIGSPRIICGPLPLSDGEISCAHGILPAPAPAVLYLLPGMSVKAFPVENAGELVTPTAAALLHALRAGFGSWPEFYIDCTALVYGSREFPAAANGAIFAYGRVN